MTGVVAGRWAAPPIARGVRRLARFVSHALEMVLAMIVGMLVLGVPVGIVARLLGVHDLYHDQAVVGAVVMAAEMTLPMAWWMDRRGHDRRMIVEMSAAMTIPAVALVTGAVLGVIDGAVIMTWQDPLMYVAMLAAMLWRWSAYSGGHPAH
jgi:fructose-specific phosphotransferase system IIC component